MTSKEDLIKVADASATADVSEYLSVLSLGLDHEWMFLRRYIPVRLFVSEEKQAARIYASLVRYLQTFGFEVANEYGNQAASWLRKIIARTITPKRKEDVLKDLEKAKRGLELYGIQKQQAEADKDQAEAAAILIKALENTEGAVLQIGSVLVVKRGSEITARTLTQVELQFVEENPPIAMAPEMVGKALSWLDAKDSHDKKLKEARELSKSEETKSNIPTGAE